MDRAEKTEAVEELKSIFATSGVVVLGHYSGLTVAEMTVLRRRLGAEGASLKVVKNRLAKIALQDHPAAAGATMFTGPTAIAYSKDPISATKVSVTFAKEKDKFVLIGGLMGATVLNQDGVKALATLPSLDELRGKIVGLLQAPATKIAGVIQAPGSQLARVISAYAAKDQDQAAA
jgi:large subunit ribosomal protein L10